MAAALSAPEASGLLHSQDHVLCLATSRLTSLSNSLTTSLSSIYTYNLLTSLPHDITSSLAASLRASYPNAPTSHLIAA